MADLMWRCGARVLDLSRPVVMGILNVTPDSFSDGGDYAEPIAAFTRAREMLAEGAGILDIGGESTRPGAEPVSPAEQIARVRPIITGLSVDGPVISVDTRSAEVAAACVEAGASIINDVSGFRDPAMVEVAAGCSAGVVIMHMLGEPRSMQSAPVYTDVVSEVTRYLEGAALRLRDAGIARDRIALDPGIGFGKTLQHNLELLAGLDSFVELGYPVLVGLSRKRFIGELTGIEGPAARLGGSVGGAVIAAERGASVLRVHDVAATVQALAVSSAIVRGRP